MKNFRRLLLALIVLSNGFFKVTVLAGAFEDNLIIITDVKDRTLGIFKYIDRHTGIQSELQIFCDGENYVNEANPNSKYGMTLKPIRGGELSKLVFFSDKAECDRIKNKVEEGAHLAVTLNETEIEENRQVRTAPNKEIFYRDTFTAYKVESVRQIRKDVIRDTRENQIADLNSELEKLESRINGFTVGNENESDDHVRAYQGYLESQTNQKYEILETLIRPQNSTK